MTAAPSAGLPQAPLEPHALPQATSPFPPAPSYIRPRLLYSSIPTPGLPRPVTTAMGDDPSWFVRNGVEQSARVPLLMAFTGTLVAAFANQPKAALLFFGAGTTILAIFLLPREDARAQRTRNAPPILQVFLWRMPEIFTVASCILTLLAIKIVFSDHVALVALVLFLVFAVLAAANIALWAVVAIYVVALLTLIAFAILVFIA